MRFSVLLVSPVGCNFPVCSRGEAARLSSPGAARHMPTGIGCRFVTFWFLPSCICIAPPPSLFALLSACLQADWLRITCIPARDTFYSGSVPSWFRSRCPVNSAGSTTFFLPHGRWTVTAAGLLQAEKGRGRGANPMGFQSSSLHSALFYQYWDPHQVLSWFAPHLPLFLTWEVDDGQIYLSIIIL